MVRTLSREEGKLITRRRLLEAAAKLLAEAGYGGLSASAVARAAGVAQPTFYVHFRDKDELLQVLSEERIGALRARLREARGRVREGQGVEAVRDTFRVPLQTFLEDPGLFRLYTQEARQPGSPLGAHALRLREELWKDLVDDLAGLGLPATTPAEREEVEMIAEAMIAQTEALASGYLEGRYTSVESLVELLTRFAVGVLGLR